LGHDACGGQDITAAIEGIPFGNRQLKQINRIPFDEILLDRSTSNNPRLDGFGESIFKDAHQLTIGSLLGYSEKPAHPFFTTRAVGEQTATEGVAMVFDVLEQERRPVLARYLPCDRSKLLVPIHFRFDAL
jgi:hypothetical protein